MGGVGGRVPALMPLPPPSPSMATPRWLRQIRSAAPLDTCVVDEGLLGGTCSYAADRGPAFVSCAFTSPWAPQGPHVLVRALVDTGSSDCELRPSLLQRLPALPIVASGAVYETSIGGEAYEAYEVLLTVMGRTCVAVVTCTDEYSSDDALVGHMALGALQLCVDCSARHLVPWTSPCEPLSLCNRNKLRPPAVAGSLRAVGLLQCASWRADQNEPHRCLQPVVGLPPGCLSVPLRDWSCAQQYRRPCDIAPHWLPLNATAVEVEGLDLDGVATFRGSLLPQIVPVTYVRCTFTSPLAPHSACVVVDQALVDTGAADCELREGLLRRLGPLPVVARGLLYETVAGRVAHDSYEVLITVQGRTCAAAVTVAPEDGIVGRICLGGGRPRGEG